MMEQERKITYAQAVCEAIDEEMAHDKNVILLGQNVGFSGGSFKTFVGLQAKYGDARVVECPISENAYYGLATGAALYGARPIVDSSFMEFTLVTYDQIVNHTAKIRYLSAGQIKNMPVIMLVGIGGGRNWGAHHAQSLYHLYAGMPGIKVVYPNNPYDAKGMLKTAIRQNDPVIFCQPIPLFARKGVVPEGEYTIPFGQCKKLMQGDDLTVAAFGLSAVKALEACGVLKQEGINIDLIDIRSLVPLDIETVNESVRRTGRLLLVDEGTESFGITGEIAFRVMQGCLHSLKSPIERLTMADIVIPVGSSMEEAVLVSPEKIYHKIKAALKG
ncbi:MAG: alpha-ketoacid dehydrogenase subunit beta [Christensenellales bacterium]